MAESRCDRCGGTFAAEKNLVQDYILAETDTTREQSGGRITTTMRFGNFVPAPVTVCGACAAGILKKSLAGNVALMGFFSLLFLAFTLAVGDPILIVLTSLLHLSFAYFLAATLTSMRRLRAGTFAGMPKWLRIHRPEVFLREVAAEKAPRLLKNVERAVPFRDRDGLKERIEGFTALTPKELERIRKNDPVMR
jgi:hypothetical protein